MTAERDYTRPDESVDPDAAVRANNELWDEWTQIHERSEFYDLEGFKSGERRPILASTGLRLVCVDVVVRGCQRPELRQRPACGDLIVDALGPLVLRAVAGVDRGSHTSVLRQA